MGYTTNFRGEFRISPPLTEEHRAYLTAFAGSRRMLRDAALAGERPDPVREAVGLPVSRVCGASGCPTAMGLRWCGTVVRSSTATSRGWSTWSPTYWGRWGIGSTGR